MKGTVKWYNPRKGYGFIQVEDGNDVFMHNTAIPEGTGYLHEGYQGEYDILDTERGLNAKNKKNY